MVGKVPANMCRIFSSLLNERNVSTITCVAVGTPTLSKYTEPQQSFKRKKSGKDREGGGAMIQCKYILKCYNSCYNDVLEKLKKSFDLVDL